MKHKRLDFEIIGFVKPYTNNIFGKSAGPPMKTDNLFEDTDEVQRESSGQDDRCLFS